MDLVSLYKKCVSKAHELGYDVFNALDIMENQKVFEELKFSEGDGFLQYYLYNWKLKKGVIYPHELGLILM